MFKDVIAGSIQLDVRVFSPPTPKTKFVVGQFVSVSRRTEVGVCQPGGVARITSANADKNGCESYDVTYVVGSTKEKSLPASIIKEHVVFEGRPRRSIESENTGTFKVASIFYSLIHECFSFRG